MLLQEKAESEKWERPSAREFDDAIFLLASREYKS
jgi:hypothetical protein